MRKFKKRTARRVSKAINIFVASLLLLQPVSAPGILGAIATDNLTGETVSSSALAIDSASKEDLKPEMVSPIVPKEELVPAPASTLSPAKELKFESAPDIQAPVSVEASAPAVSVTSPNIEVVTQIPPDTKSADASTTDNISSKVSETISPDATASNQNTNEKNGQVCLDSGVKINDSAKSDWDVSGKIAETKEKVELGVRYAFPGNNKVSVTFSCLPAKSDDRATLKIQEIKASEVRLPEGVSAASEYAYDITTEMKEGDFKYNLTLPKAENSNADINYIKKTATEVKNQGLSTSDLKPIEDSEIKEENSQLKVSDLNHFCVYIPTYCDKGSITIVKDARPNDSQNFSFTTSGNGLSNFILDDDSNPNLSNIKTFSGLSAGAYSITERMTNGWMLDDINCTSGGTRDISHRKANINLVAGQNVTCTFINKKQSGTLTVNKILVPSNDPGLFNLKIDGTTYAANVGDGGTTGARIVSTGDHTVSETAGIATNLFGYTTVFGGACSCNGTVNISTGENKICTITNTRNTGDLKAIKVVDDGSDLTNWSFRLDNGSSVSADNNGLVDFGQVTTLKKHTIYESGPDGYTLASVSCNRYYTDNSNGSVTTTVGKNGTTICTFNNNAEKGTITIVKDAQPNDEQDFTFGTTGRDLAPFALDDNGNNDDGVSNTKTFSALYPGAYSINEDAISGWDLTNLSCSESGSHSIRDSLIDINNKTAIINLEPGENVTCTFTNTLTTGLIIAHKYEDKYPSDGGGQIIGTDANLANWEMSLYPEDDCQGTVLASGNTGSDGNHIFSNLAAGRYSIKETLKNHWQNITPICQNISVAAGETPIVNFGNFFKGSINVCKYQDYNGSGSWDFGDTGIQGWAMTAHNITTDTTYNMLTASNGCALFSDLPYGIYDVSEEVRDGWIKTWPIYNDPRRVWVTSSASSSGISYYNFQSGSISGQKFNDLNENGVKDVEENGLSNWTINLDKNLDGNIDVTTTTDSNGNYQFTNLSAGNYQVSEIQQTGWKQTTANPDAVIIESGTNVAGVDFGNYQLGKISGYKFDDLDRNGIWSKPGEAGLENWTINLCKYENSGTDGEDLVNEINTFVLGSYAKNRETSCNLVGSVVTDTGGYYEFTGLEAGDYRISETNQAGWSQTAPSDGLYDNIRVQSGVGISENKYSYDFGNYFLVPRLIIQKSNNKFPVDQHPGDDVTYALTITAYDANVNDVNVVDLPPNGFKYRGGSWTAHSSVRGNIKNSPTTEPAYHSPGDWKLGDMKKDEVVTLTYIADISTFQDPGLYPDLAWTQGVDEKNEQVLGVGTNSNFVQDAFVGTEVAVVKLAGTVAGAAVEIEKETKTRDEDEKTVYKTLLLPATGANPGWIAAALLILLAGVGFLRAGKRKGREKKPQSPNGANIAAKAMIAGLAALSAVLGANVSQAATTLAAQMETPKSPYQTTDFSLGFVALDLNGDPVTVQCFLGNSAMPFQIVSLAQGGTSGSCNVNSGVISGDGIYNFHITATDGNEIFTAPDVSLEVITGGPKTPTSYERTKVTDCRNNLKAVAANDGKTEWIEIYRSTETEFTADAGTLVKSIDAGPGQEISYTDTEPDCDETYYYAMRAFDALGNGSGTVADERTVVRTTGGGTRTVTTAVTAPGGAITAATGEEATGEAAEGTISGVETEGEVAGEEASLAEEGNVLGDKTNKADETAQGFFQRNKALSFIIALIILTAVYYAATRKRKSISPKDSERPSDGNSGDSSKE